MKNLNNAVSQILRNFADNIDCGTCELEEGEALDLISSIAHIKMNKLQVADRYGVSTKTIERRESSGDFPQSHNASVSKKQWYLDELIKFENDYERMD